MKRGSSRRCRCRSQFQHSNLTACRDTSRSVSKSREPRILKSKLQSLRRDSRRSQTVSVENSQVMKSRFLPALFGRTKQTDFKLSDRRRDWQPPSTVTSLSVSPATRILTANHHHLASTKALTEGEPCSTGLLRVVPPSRPGVLHVMPPFNEWVPPQNATTDASQRCGEQTSITEFHWFTALR